MILRDLSFLHRLKSHVLKQALIERAKEDFVYRFVTLELVQGAHSSLISRQDSTAHPQGAWDVVQML